MGRLSQPGDRLRRGQDLGGGAGGVQGAVQPEEVSEAATQGRESAVEMRQLQWRGDS